jgi:RES domain-containing protein
MRESTCWSGIGFRSVIPRYANARDMLSGAGAFRGGGRWNPPGIYAVYASLEPGLSVNEAMRVVFSDRGFSVEDMRPRLVAALRCRLNAIIDLSSDSVVPSWLALNRRPRRAVAVVQFSMLNCLLNPCCWTNLSTWMRWTRQIRSLLRPSEN